MSSPTCISLGVKPPSLFCSQECFTANWTAHTEVHKALKKLKKDQSKLPNEFRNYQFTGSLRPCMQSPRREVPAHIMKPDYATDIRGVSREGREVLDIAGRAVVAGITCDELDRIVHDETVKRNAYPSPLNYYEFPKSVCTSVNEVICHGIPDYTELKNGDIVNIDISVFCNGFHGDLNETFFVGNVDADGRRLVKCAYETLSAAIDMVRPGTLYRDLGARIQEVADAAGCSVVTTYCGHGIGRLFHTSPNVPHYARNKAKGSMEVGHIFTIEPMINLGQKEDVLWPDNWTAVTRDGSRSSQFEHTMVVTATGCELLTGRVGEPTDRIVWTDDKFQR